jgi:hypothetical protein
MNQLVLEDFSMEFKELATLYFERGVAGQTLWFDYATIVLLLLGFIVAFKSHELKYSLRWWLFVGFLGFAIANGWAQFDVTAQRIAIGNRLLTLIADATTRTNSVSMPLAIPKWWAVIGAHLIGDIFVALAIFVLHRPDRLKTSS